jgi:hypothetical protein
MSRKFLKICLVFSILAPLIFINQNVFAGDDWKTVSPEEIALKSPKIETDADAEALFWEVYVADEAEGGSPRTVLKHYLRIKIFTEKGREDNSKVDIPFGKIAGSDVNIRIRDIAARTIKSDGTIVELNPKDIYEREIIKANQTKIKAKSFALPGIEVGSIIEYRWKEIRGDSLSFYERLQLARDIPVHQVKYHIKPLSLPNFPYGMSIQTFNGRTVPFVKEKDGYYGTSLSNVPSFKEEERMPPESSVRPWLLVYYTEDRKQTPEKFWQEEAKSVYESHKSQMKVNDEIKKASAEAVGDAGEPLAKIEKIFNYVRTNVKNIYDDASGLTPDQIKQIKENKNASDVLKRKTGDWHDINMLFGAMVSAAGFDVRIAKLPRRSDMNFSQDFTDNYFLRTENIAVKVGEEWKFFDPGNRYVSFGMLSWEEEGQPSLISDPKNAVWVTSPYSPIEKSMEKRSGKFKLLEDGTLEGEARMEFTGHVAAFYKEYNDDYTQEQREQYLRNLVKINILGSAEIAGPTIENVSDPNKPFIYTFKVRVPGFATRTGKRLFFQPNVFERNSKPMFAANTRKNDIFINYPWSESDDIEIQLPEGYSLESPDAPVMVQDGQGISKNDINISITKDGKTLFYKRNFYFGNNGLLYFQVKSYAAVKTLFDAFYKANSHQLTVRQGPPPAASSTTPN